MCTSLSGSCGSDHTGNTPEPAPGPAPKPGVDFELPEHENDDLIRAFPGAKGGDSFDNNGNRTS